MSRHAPTRGRPAGAGPTRALLTPVVAVLSAAALLAGCTGKPATGAAQPTEPPPTPLTAASSVTDAAPSSPAPSSLSAAPTTASPAARPDYVFPVRTKTASFGRTHHDYPATDIFAPCGTAALAVTDGVVDAVNRKDSWTPRTNDGATRGGLSVSIVGSDGVRYYGSHLRSIEAAIVPGHPVRAGDVLGKVGRTGSARPTPCHLHFGISPPCAEQDWWNRRGVLSPYPFLTSWKKSGQRSPVKPVADWKAAHGCPKKAPAS